MWKFLLYVFMVPITNGEMAQQGCGECDENKLVSYLANLEVLSPESIFSLPITDIEGLCKKLDKNLKPIDEYMKLCPAPDLYASLVRGVRTLNDKLCCADMGFYRQFSMFRLCLVELKNDFESCNGPADWNEEEDEIVCRTYKSIVDCYYIKAAKVCGKEAAKTITELIEDVINSVIGTKCPEVDSKPYVEDTMPANYVRRNGAEKVFLDTCITTIIAELLFLQYILV